MVVVGTAVAVAAGGAEDGNAAAADDDDDDVVEACADIGAGAHTVEASWVAEQVAGQG